jgi:hypothetical protein
MTQYNASTRERIGDINQGLIIETGDLDTGVYHLQKRWSIFKVYGRIMVNWLWGEVTLADLVGGVAGTLHQFNYQQTLPVIASVDLCAVCTDIDGLIIGTRLTCPGDDSATACAITAAEGISYTPGPPIMLGVATASGVQQHGLITFETTTQDMASGSIRYSMLYTPLDDDAYVEVSIAVLT